MFSPNGHWVAYQFGEPGSTGELLADPLKVSTYTEPFSPTGRSIRLPTRGGRPLWSRDGTELFFIPSGTLLSVVDVGAEPSLTFTSPVAVPRGFGVAAAVDSSHIRHHARRPDSGRRGGRAERKRNRAGADSRRAELVRRAEGARAHEIRAPRASHLSRAWLPSRTQSRWVLRARLGALGARRARARSAEPLGGSGFRHYVRRLRIPTGRRAA